MDGDNRRCCASAEGTSADKLIDEPAQRGARPFGVAQSCARDLRDSSAAPSSPMEFRVENLGKLAGPLIVASALGLLLHVEFDWSLRWSVVVGLFVAVRLQKWALI